MFLPILLTIWFMKLSPIVTAFTFHSHFLYCQNPCIFFELFPSSPSTLPGRPGSYKNSISIHWINLRVTTHLMRLAFVFYRLVLFLCCKHYLLLLRLHYSEIISVLR